MGYDITIDTRERRPKRRTYKPKFIVPPPKNSEILFGVGSKADNEMQERNQNFEREQMRIKYGAKPTIQTVDGEKKYYKTEVEDENGRWNDNYYTRDGYWVIHRGNYHDVYY